MNTKITRIALTSLALLTPALVSAQVAVSVCVGAGCGVAGVAIKIINLINTVLVPLLFALAFIVFLYGIALKYIFSSGDETKVKEGHKLILWGIIGFVVMVSLWGLVNVVATTFNLQGFAAPQTPTSN